MVVTPARTGTRRAFGAWQLLPRTGDQIVHVAPLPRPGTSWRLVISLAGLWLAAAIVLATVAAPANAAQKAPTTTAAIASARVQPAGQRPEAPFITVLLAGGAVATVAIRSRGTRRQPARQAVRIR